MYDIAEKILLKYVFGTITAKQAQTELKRHGLKADLRGNSHLINVWPIAGGYVIEVEV